MCGQFYLPNGLHLQQIWMNKIILNIVPIKTTTVLHIQITV